MISHTKSPTAPQVQSSEHHACANKPHTDQLTRIRHGSSSTQRADSLSDTRSLFGWRGSGFSTGAALSEELKPF